MASYLYGTKNKNVSIKSIYVFKNKKHSINYYSYVLYRLIGLDK